MKATRCFGHRVLVALFTLSILLSGAVPIYAADYTGKTVTAVDVSGNVTVPTSTIMAVVKVKPGDKCDNAKTQQDMRAIFGLGSFFDVVTNYSEVPEGIKITYTVNENPSVKTVIIQGIPRLPVLK